MVFQEAEDEFARFLRIILRLYAAVLAIFVSVFLVLLPEARAWFAAVGVALGASVFAASVALRRGRLRMAANLIILGIWTCNVASMGLNGGLRDVSYGNNVLVIVLAGLFLGGREAAILAALSLAAGLAYLVLDIRGFLPPPLMRQTLFSFWLVSVFQFFGVVVLQSLSGQAIRRSMSRARAEVAERREKESELSRANSLLHATINSTADGLLMVDCVGKVTGYNREFLRLWGIPDSVAQLGADDQLVKYVLDQLVDPDGFAARIGELYNHPAEVSFDILEFKDGKTFERYSQPQTLDETIIGRVWSFRDVTQRRRYDDALRKSEERYRMLVEQASDAIITADEKGLILGVNFSGARMLGMTREEIVGGNIRDFIAPEDLPRQREQAIEVARNGSAMTDLTFIRRDGSRFFGEGNVRALPGGLVQGIIRDVTERRRAEEALRKSEERYRLLVEQASDGIFTGDQSGHIIDVNPSGARMLGRTREEVIGIRVADMLALEERPRIKALLPTLMAGKPDTGEWVFMRKDGSSFIGESSARTLPGGMTQGIIRDVTERKSLEERLRQGQKLEAIGRLAGGIAHDFNNLLTAILGSLYFVRMQISQGQDPAKDLETIQSTVERASNLTRQLLAFARRQVIQPRVASLNEICLEVDPMLRRLMGSDVEFALLPAPDVWMVRVDPGQIEQVLVNLCVNARDAMPHGGKIVVSTSNASFGADEAGRPAGVPPGDWARLSVSDTGEGMTPEVMERIFEPFFTTKEQGKGTGLGLATSHGIIRQSGGHIEVTSRPGEGSTFTIYLPRSLDLGSHKPHERESSPHGTETILLAEDEPGVRQLAVRALRQLGYTVLEAANGAEALRVAEEHGKSVDLLLTDAVMPQMGGRELADRMRVKTPGLKVLLATGYPAGMLAQKGALNPGLDYIHKPYTPGALARRVRQALDGGATGEA